MNTAKQNVQEWPSHREVRSQIIINTGVQHGLKTAKQLKIDFLMHPPQAHSGRAEVGLKRSRPKIFPVQPNGRRWITVLSFKTTNK